MITTYRRKLTKLALGAALVLGGALGVQAAVIYDSIPDPEPGNLPSLGYQATQTAQFGDDVKFAGTARSLTHVTLALSDWAVASDFNLSTPGYDANGYDQALTLTLYNVTNPGASPTVGSQLAALTVTAHVPWHTPNGFNGTLFDVDFDFSSLNVTVPNELIFGLSFNTQTYGTNPTGVSGPYNSLNFGLSGAATVGSQANPDTAFWNTSTAGNYADGGTAGVGIFRQDQNWDDGDGNLYIPAARFEAIDPVVPEPATLTLLGIGIAGFGAIRRRRARIA